MTSPTPLATYLKQHPDTQYVDAILCDLSCVMRGKRYPIDAADKLFTDGMMLPGSSFLLSASGKSMDPEGIGISDGDPDYIARPIDDTLVAAPWTRYPTAQVLLTMQTRKGQPYRFEPRNVLACVIEQFNELGIRPIVAFELEFYLLDPANDNGQHLQPPQSPLSQQRSNATQVYSIDDIEDFSHYLHEVHEACSQQGVACGAISAEYAPCQFEINLDHTDQLLKAADQCVMFRRIVQCVAKKHQLQATFMAKPYAEHAGSGLHLHISLVDKDGKNLFISDDGQLMLNSIGGLQQTMAECMALFAPNINSYHRFVPDSYVPVSPSWGFDNRSVAFRIPQSPAHARRIEHRVAGADANPYLTLAALLAGIHHGISNRIAASDRTRGNAGAALDPKIPFTPLTAFEQCRDATILPNYIEPEYLKVYSSCKKNEYHAFKESESPEASWYL